MPVSTVNKTDTTMTVTAESIFPASGTLRSMGRVDDELERLRAVGERYEIIECDPELADTARFCEAYGYRAEDSANTIVVVGKSDPPVYAACIVLATTRLDVNGEVRRRLGTRKASFAPGDEVVARTGMTIGGVTPFGLPDDLPVWIDGAVLTRGRIVLGGGGRDRKVLAAPTILLALANSESVHNLAKAIPPD